MAEITNPVKVIRAYCLECSNGQPSEVKYCPVEKCPLFPFRFGKNPFRQKREMSEEQRQAVRDRLREARKYNSDSVEDCEDEDDE